MKFESIEILSGNFYDIKFPAVLIKKEFVLRPWASLNVWNFSYSSLLFKIHQFSLLQKNMYNELKFICSCKTPST